MKKLLSILTIVFLLTPLTSYSQLKVLSNGSTRGGTTGGALRLETNYKYVDIGCKYSNGEHSHFYTNSTYGYWFDKGLEINGGSISSFTGNLYFKTERTTHMTLYDEPVWVQGIHFARLILDGKAYATLWIDGSDSTLKEDITLIDQSRISDLYGISGKKYKLKEDSDIEQVSDTSLVKEKKAQKTERHEHFGLLAQDIQDIYPELVFKNQEGLLGINYSGFIPLLIEALKE